MIPLHWLALGLALIALLFFSAAWLDCRASRDAAARKRDALRVINGGRS